MVCHYPLLGDGARPADGVLFIGIDRKQENGMEESMVFFADGYQLEGLCDLQPGNPAVVVTHPHPSYGGDMHNVVVETIVRCYRQAGYSTLRFNFRGTGRSQGVFDNGDGEQRDILAAVAWLKDKGCGEIDLAGYSFGSWVNARLASSEKRFRRLVLISPPVTFISFAGIGPLSNLSLTMVGDRDEFAALAEVKAFLQQIGKTDTLQVIDGADHFFIGYTTGIETVLLDHLSSTD
jgi:uncharacterized protein